MKIKLEKERTMDMYSVGGMVESLLDRGYTAITVIKNGDEFEVRGTKEVSA